MTLRACVYAPCELFAYRDITLTCVGVYGFYVISRWETLGHLRAGSKYLDVAPSNR